LKLRHPITGIYQYIQRSGQMGSGTNVNLPPSSVPTSTPTNANTNIPSTTSINPQTISIKISEGEEVIPFRGSDLLRWLTVNNYSEPDKMGQLLLNFRYICPITEIDLHTSETFSPDALYRFQVKNPK
jgi:hypothetical protein